MRITVAALAFAGALSALAVGTPQESKGVAWAKSWDEAYKEALERNVPILFTIQADSSSENPNPGSERMVAAFRDGAFINASRKIVCVVAHMIDPKAKHPTKKVRVGKEVMEVCALYDGLTCDQHVITEEPIANYFKSPRFDVPSQIWLRPDRKELEPLRHTGPDGSGSQSATELIRDIDQALLRVPGAKLHRKDWLQYTGWHSEAEEQLQKGEYKKAIDAAQKLKDAKSEIFVKRGEQFLSQMDQNLSFKVDQIVQQAKKDPKKAREDLSKIVKECKGMKCAEKAEEELKKLPE